VKQVDLSKYNNDWFKPAGTLKKTLWYFTNMCFFKTMFDKSKGDSEFYSSSAAQVSLLMQNRG
jgi:hypothetical protein